VITLDPSTAQQGTVWLDLPSLGLKWGESFGVRDEVGGIGYTWGQANFVRLEPWRAVCHIMTVLRG